MSERWSLKIVILTDRQPERQAHRQTERHTFICCISIFILAVLLSDKIYIVLFLKMKASNVSRTNRYQDKKFGRIGGYKQGLRKENNNQPQNKEEENQTAQLNDFTNESETADNDEIEEKIDDTTEVERKSGHQFGRVGSSSFNNEFSNRRRRPNQE